MHQAQYPSKAGGPAQDRIFCFGEKVQYLSRRTGQWIPAIVQGHAVVAAPGGPEFHYHLDVQEAAHPSRVRAAETPATQVTPVTQPAKPTAPAQPKPELQPKLLQQPQRPLTPSPVALPPPASAPAHVCPVPAPCTASPAAAGLSKTTRWQLMCLHAEGFSQDVLQALPSTLRALPLQDGKSHLGRQHQAKFLEALLVNAPQFLSIISRTHADVEAPAGSSKIRITNLTLNPIFVNTTALWQGQSSELGPGATLSFARNQGDDTPHHFLVLQLQALDAGMQNEVKGQAAKAEAKALLQAPTPIAPAAPTPSAGPPQPPSPSAMPTVDVAKVGIPTEVLQHLRAMETCKLDSPKTTTSSTDPKCAPKEPREPASRPKPVPEQDAQADPKPAPKPEMQQTPKTPKPPSQQKSFLECSELTSGPSAMEARAG